MKLNAKHIQILEQVKERLIERGPDNDRPDFICIAVSQVSKPMGYDLEGMKIETAIEQVLRGYTFGEWLSKNLGLTRDRCNDDYYLRTNQARLGWVETMIARREII